MPVNKIILPFILLALVFLYVGWEIDESYSKWMIVPLVISAILYVSGPQVNWWYWQRYPPDLEPGSAQLLEKFNPFYKSLTEEQKKKFRTRVFLFKNGVDWTPIAWPEESLPEDVKLAISSAAVQMTYGRDEYLMEKFEKVIVYPKPFPSPEYPFGHSSELHQADGCLIFSAEHLMTAFTQPGKYYNIALHEYAKAFKISNPKEDYPVFEGESTVWEKLESVSGMGRNYVEGFIGLAGIDAFPVAVHHFFTYPASFLKVFPVEAAQFQKIFNKISNLPSA